MVMVEEWWSGGGGVVAVVVVVVEWWRCGSSGGSGVGGGVGGRGCGGGMMDEYFTIAVQDSEVSPSPSKSLDAASGFPVPMRGYFMSYFLFVVVISIRWW
ncbi:hypothetical protein RHMOL_Rhmol09G0059600 [Rhododendron molle]|uniref:Uncharacterized protein n=1 Tax=Rhododendron molle TaxID=49168 RepID=A0ACC0MA46_RHOML|nr:hypothetical protein RHMOL_Rhmol09G0059600 [Rhododendron molle]